LLLIDVISSSVCDDDGEQLRVQQICVCSTFSGGFRGILNWHLVQDFSFSRLLSKILD
jgi:hypothetical protein